MLIRLTVIRPIYIAMLIVSAALIAAIVIVIAIRAILIAVGMSIPFGIAMASIMIVMIAKAKTGYVNIDTAVRKNGAGKAHDCRT